MIMHGSIITSEVLEARHLSQPSHLQVEAADAWVPASGHHDQPNLKLLLRAV